MTQSQSNKAADICPIPWYREDQWQLLRENAPDADEIEKTYQEYKAGMQQAMEEMRAAGLEPTKLLVDVEEMMLWCAQQRRDFDAESRSVFMSLKTNNIQG